MSIKLCITHTMTYVAYIYVIIVYKNLRTEYLINCRNNFIVSAPWSNNFDQILNDFVLTKINVELLNVHDAQISHAQN